MGRRIAQAFAQDGVDYDLAGECTLGNSICAFVASGAGVAILDALAARGAVEAPITVRPFVPSLRWEPKLLFPTGSPRSRPLTLLIREIRARLAELAAAAPEGIVWR